MNENEFKQNENKILKMLKWTKFYDSLYSLETAEISNGQKLMHSLFDKSNKELKSSKK